MVMQSDPREIVQACFPTFPANGELAFADLFSAKWLSEDCISVIIHSRRYITEPWGDAYIARQKLCRHRNWKYACDACKLHTENTLENYMKPTPRRDRSAV